MIVALFSSGRGDDLTSGQFVPEKKWFFIFCGIMILSALFSSFWGICYRFLIEYMKTILLLVGIVSILKNEDDFKSLSSVILASAITLSLPIIIGGITDNRISVGTYYDPNDLSMVMNCSIPFLIFLLYSENKKIKIISMLTILFSIIAIIATQSRMGFLALIFNGIFYVYFTRATDVRILNKIMILSFVIVTFSAVAGELYWDRMGTILSKEQTGSGRTLIWKRSLLMISEHPISGTGPGTFVSSYGRMLRSGSFESVGNEYDRAWKTAHNSYLIVASELGVFGLIAFLMVLWNSVGCLNRVRNICRNRDDGEAVLYMANAVLSSFLIFIFCSLFLSQAYSSVLIILIGSSILVRKINQRKIVMI